MSKENNFKRTSYYVKDQVESARLQKAMFKLGFKWASQSGAGVVRTVERTGTTYIYVDEDCRMYFSGSANRATTGKWPSFTQKPLSLVYEAAEAKALEKKAARKASRQRASLKAAGWVFPQSMADVPVGVPVDLVFIDKSELSNFTLHTQTYCVERYRLVQKVVTLQEMVAGIVKDAGGVEVQHVDSDGFVKWNPGSGFRVSADGPGWSGNLPKGTVIDVKYRNGEVRKGRKAGEDSDASGAFWRDDAMGMDIVAYRICSLKVGSLSALGGGVGTITAGTLNINASSVQVFDANGNIRAKLPAETQADTNPKRQYGVSSVPLNMWSPLASAYGALALYNGALKYGKANFANTPVEASIYIAAAMRHLSAFAAGEEFDPADGVPNLGGVLANVAIILEARAAGTLIDDRLRMSGYLKERDALKEIVASLNALHAGKNPKHYTLEGQ